MANPKSKQKTVLKRGKKKWFKVVTPEYLRSIELGEITAHEPASLPGRTICVPLKEVSGSMRDSSSKMKFRIDIL